MHLPSARDMMDIIRKVGHSCFLYFCDLSQAYRQLPLDLADWLLVCIKVQKQFLINISLPFDLRWAADCCQDVPSLIDRNLINQGLQVFKYIYDFGGVASTKWQTEHHFEHICTTLK